MEAGSMFELWVYLSSSPLLWLTVTIGVFLLSRALAKACGEHPIVNPVLISICVIAGILHFTATSYADFFSGAQFIHFALGPATVALGAPLYRNRALILSRLAPIAVALLVGSVAAIFSAVGLAMLVGLPDQLALSLAPKSVTVGVAMGVSEQIGASPSLTAVAVVATGVLGAIIATPVMNAFKIRDFAARGFALGLTSHGIGTARAFQVNETAGAFASLAMALNSLVTALLAPLILKFF